MYHYRLYCTDIISDVEFVQLVKGPDIPVNPDTAVTIRAGHFPDELRPEKACYSYISERGSHLTNPTCLIYIPDNNTIEYELRPEANPGYLQSYLLGWGMSMLMFQRRTPVIHCSALYNDSGAFLISGLSGSGKSTMTTYLLEDGMSFLADDTSAAVFEDNAVSVTPCFPYRKLCRDMVVAKNLDLDELIYIDEDKDKFLVPYDNGFPDEPKPVKALIFLEPVSPKVEGTHPPIESMEITGFAKMNYIRRAMFLFPLFKDRNNDSYLFQMCLDLAGKIPVYRVFRPTDRDSKDEVFGEIKKIIAKYN